MSDVRKRDADVQNAKTRKITIQAYSPAELANIYGIKWGVMNQWLKYLEEFTGKRVSRFYTPKQVEIIFEHLGLPKEKEIEILEDAVEKRARA